jgi:hypothetical protein
MMELGTINTIFAVAIPVFVVTMVIEWRLSRDHEGRSSGPSCRCWGSR